MWNEFYQIDANTGNAGIDLLKTDKPLVEALLASFNLGRGRSTARPFH